MRPGRLVERVSSSFCRMIAVVNRRKFLAWFVVQTHLHWDKVRFEISAGLGLEPLTAIQSQAA